VKPERVHFLPEMIFAPWKCFLPLLPTSARL
jgi:hypothetical protein